MTPEPARPAPATPDALLDRARDDRAALLSEPSSLCPNCGSVLPGAFCPHCGQRSRSIRQPVGAFVRDTFVEIFGLDGRTWRSFGVLLFRPGGLTVEYVDGKRARSLSPLKLYLTATLLFFVTLGLVESDEPVVDVTEDAVAPVAAPLFPPDSLLPAPDAADALDAWAFSASDQHRALALAAGVLGRADTAAARRLAPVADSVQTAALRFARLRDSVRALPDTASVRAGAVGLSPAAGTRAKRTDGDDDGVQFASADLVRELPDWLKGDVARGIERARTPAEKDAAQEAALDALIGQIPTAMFGVLPVFAVLLKLLYAGGGGIEPRGRRQSAPPAGAAAGAGSAARVWAALRGVAWRTGQAVKRRQVRRRVRIARRPWWRAVRRLRARLPAGLRVGRVGWLRRAATARRTRFYAEHVVFTLHVHAFAFLVFWALLLVDAGGTSGMVAGWLVLSIPAYFLFAQRRVYAQTWGKTLVKSALLGTAYTVVLTFGVLLAGALAARLG